MTLSHREPVRRLIGSTDAFADCPIWQTVLTNGAQGDAPAILFNGLHNSAQAVRRGSKSQGEDGFLIT